MTNALISLTTDLVVWRPATNPPTPTEQKAESHDQH